MSSSFLENLMRSGSQTYNAKVTLAGTTLTIASYDGVPYSSINPMLCRFTSTDTTVYTGANLSLDFSGISFGLPDYDGNRTLYVGLLRVDDATVIPTLSLIGETGVLTTVTMPRQPETFAASVVTGHVIIIAKVMNVERLGGWSTDNSWIEE